MHENKLDKTELFVEKIGQTKSILAKSLKSSAPKNDR